MLMLIFTTLPLFTFKFIYFKFIFQYQKLLNYLAVMHTCTYMPPKKNQRNDITSFIQMCRSTLLGCIIIQMSTHKCLWHIACEKWCRIMLLSKKNDPKKSTHKEIPSWYISSKKSFQKLFPNLTVWKIVLNFWFFFLFFVGIQKGYCNSLHRLNKYI